MRTLKQFLEDGEQHIASLPLEEKEPARLKLTSELRRLYPEAALLFPEEGGPGEGCCYLSYFKDDGEVFEGDVRDLPRTMVDLCPQAPDAVDLGQIHVETVEDEMGGVFEGGGGMCDSSTWTSRAVLDKSHERTCRLCATKFKGTVNAEWCDECKSPKWAFARRELRAAPSPSPAPVERICARAGCGNQIEALRVTKRYCSENCRKRANEGK